MDPIKIVEKSKDYELLDSGDGMKLERFGDVVLSRPDTQALWKKSLEPVQWSTASAVFEKQGLKAKWNIKKEIAKNWKITLGDLVFNLELLPSKHVGVFPEQSENWQWLREKISEEIKNGKNDNRKISVLNLFANTGGATLSCAKAGAEVCHVDSSESSVETAKKNRDDSGLSHSPIRFIVDDVRKFVEREIKRGKKYDVILLDPPVYGKGTKKEVWKIEEDLVPLLSRIEKILSDHPVAVVLNGYASVYSRVTYGEMLKVISKKYGGSISSGELVIEQSADKRLLPCGIFARWESGK